MNFKQIPNYKEITNYNLIIRLMKYIFLSSLLLLALLSCLQNPETKTDATSLNNSIEGSWKLVYAEIRENDSVQVTDLSQIEFMKIMNKDHFAFFNQQKDSDENFLAGGGRYSFDGENYIETLEFVNIMDLRGHEFPFKVMIKGDSLIQSGHEEVPEAGLDRYILEKYVRIK